MIQKIGIIGAGTMGRGIAQICASSGLSVTLCDVGQEQLDDAAKSIETGYTRMVQRERMSQQDCDAALSKLSFDTSLDALAGSDLTIEAATETPEVKLPLFEKIADICGEKAILASNTSSISLTRIAAAVPRPERVIGMHFFNPVPVMQLLEIVRALQTNDSTYNAACRVAEQLNKTRVTVSDSPGFVVNRILLPMINEAVLSLAEGLATAEEIDVAMRLGANHPMGPLALADLIGLDVCLYVMETLYDQFGDSKYRPAPLLRKMVDAKYLGRKTGRGFFTYG
ncbi:MAG: 3-hydroxybutyryl-CoA dehydrogenase [Gammaproteobacteria bacterium]